VHAVDYKLVTGGKRVKVGEDKNEQSENSNLTVFGWHSGRLHVLRNASCPD